MNCRNFIILLITLLTSLDMWADSPVRARFLNMQNGLSSNNVKAIVQDSKGYIWMGTSNGLVRYDGYNAILLTPSKASNRKFMLDSRIQDMHLYKNRYLLLRLRGGKYSCYDTEIDCFVNYQGNYDKIFREELPRSLPLPVKLPKDSKVRCDHRGNTYAITPQYDIWYMDAKSKKLTFIKGIYNEELFKLNSKPRIHVLTDCDGIIWISTYGNGLFQYDRKTKTTIHYSSKNFASPIQTDYLIGLYEDKTGNVWVYQENMGVSCITKQPVGINTYFFTSSEQTNHTNSIRLLEKAGNSIYMSNLSNANKVADRNLVFHKLQPELADGLLAVCCDKQGNIWKGTRKSGVYVGDKLLFAPKTSEGNVKKVSDIICDKKGRIWISFFDGGISMVERKLDGSYNFRHFFQDLSIVRCPRQLLEDHGGYIWLTSNEGVFVFHPNRLIRNGKNYQHILINKNAKQLDEMRCIIEDKTHHVLVGTQGQGLVEFDNKQLGAPKILHMWTTTDGLPNNNVEQLVADSKGNIWIGTEYGLAQYNPINHAIMKMPTGGSTLGNMFVENAACLLNDGSLAFGTYHGVVVISPNFKPHQSGSLPLGITGLDINGVPLQQQEDSTLFIQLSQKRKLHLEHTQNSLTFYFSDFDYAEDKGTRYSYRLVGYDKEWSAFSTINFGTYKNLPSGEYTLEVRSMSANGLWNKRMSAIEVIIAPPLWQTWWAYLIYIIVFLASCWSVWHYFRRINDLHNDIKVEKQLTEFKLRFFTNISHEFRTPLTVIKGAMERMLAIGNIPSGMKQPISSMNKSVERLTRLVDELLEFRKMQNNKLHLALEKTDVIEFVKEIYLTFFQIAENKHITYTFLPFSHQYMMYIDKNYMDKIIYNLLSNAFKYTMSRQAITLRITLDEGKGQICFIVEDTGIGVPKEKQAMLFTRFNQSIYTQNSIGIGLNLVQELVRTHHGKIEFKDNPEGGSIFMVTLPTDQECYEENDFLVEGNDLLREENESQMPEIQVDYQEMKSDPLNNRHVLIVEDDDHIREFLASELSHFFVVNTVSNGQEALDMLRESKDLRLSLVISDVLMPVMDGYGLVRHIRANKEMSDIPIILLTALTAEEKKIRGLDCGADAYVEKPFSVKVLVAKCRQLITQREHLQMKYAKEVVGRVEVPEIIVDEQDAKLRNLLDTWLASHIGDENLSVDTFAEKMGYGRTTFYKKVKKLTGKTPNDYVKSRRMEKALELLKDDKLSVAEVAYKIGIGDPFYFSKSFKNYFGISPTQYRKGEKPKLK